MLELTSPITREAVLALDHQDPLATLRHRFDLPADIRYFDGNSLGPLPKASPQRLAESIQQHWRQDLIQSWNLNGWIDLPRRVGARIAGVIGAHPDEVVVADSTSVNLFKLLAAALELRPERSVILSQPSQFPTDLYMAQGLASLRRPRPELRLVAGDVVSALGPDVAVVSLSHVDFKTGERAELEEITRAAHRHGALVLWDLSHSAGAMELGLSAAGVDLAVGCTYKFLNGGPGAPAYCYVARRHQEEARSPLCGWLGHREPFAFETEYRPADGIDRFQCGTPPILSLVAVDAALDLFDGVELAQLRRKSVELGELLMALVDQECSELGLEIVSPRDSERRGSQISLRHAAGYPIMQALIERGVIGDFRTPDILRFGLTPMYQRFADVWEAIATLREVLETRAWDDARFTRRGVVT